MVCIVLFFTLPIELAAISSLLGGYLLLPSGLSVDLPLVPPLDKYSVAAISTLLLCWMKGSPNRPPRERWVGYALGIAFITAPIFTSFSNSYELQVGPVSLPGFYPLDGVKWGIRNFIQLIPFYIGAKYLCTDRNRVLLLRSVITSALFYSVPMLLEVRLSPQFHRLVYGYHPQAFVMAARGEGFRPFVFLENGLAASLLVALALIAAIVAAHARWRVLRVPAGAASVYLAGLLVLCKSMGSLIYGVLLAPVVLFTRPRTWTKIAFALAVFVCAYPVLRWHGVIPTDQISALTEKVSGERATSFDIRVKNENQLLARGEEKPVFGWGTWGRNRVYDSYGKDISVTDGAWIIQFGMWGWLGYLGLFGLFALSAFRAMRAVTRENSGANYAIGGLSLVLAVNLIDMLPNASLTPITFVVAGSIVTAVRARATRKIAEPVGRETVPEPALVSR